MTARQLSAGVLARLAGYCAFRVRSLTSEDGDIRSLQQMTEHNLHELGFDIPVTLKLERPVIADGRMQPHEWIATRDGRLLKTDTGSHGDDHFYPGPTDSAWDLAGAIVEWQMSEQQAAEFLDIYERLSGDHPRSRIPDFIVAYAVFRCAYCRMAANSMQGTQEAERLEHAAAGYASLLHNLMSAGAPPHAVDSCRSLVAKMES